MIHTTTHQEELHAWLRTLDIIQQENIELKNQLADMIKNEIELKSLERAEYYQNEFLNKDTVIALLRHDVVRHNKTGKLQEDKLRRDIELMQKEFTRLKNDFQNYLIRASH